LRHLIWAFAGDSPDHRTDDQLLELYCTRRDEEAFAALVARHGRMVLGVCERLLGHREDAEDAFQATFLVLAQKATAVRRGAPLGNWLYGVASRLARFARRARGRRQARERQRASEPNLSPEPRSAEEFGALDEELARLPEVLRAPLLLCYLSGHTQPQAARQLGWSVATLRRRLVQGRALLRLRLARRGVAPAALLAATPSAVTTATAAALTSRVARAVLGGSVSSHVIALAKKGLPSMLSLKTKLGAALALTLTLSVGLAAHQALTAQQPPKQPQRNEFPTENWSGKGNVRVKPGDALPAADLDKHLAEAEQRLEAALKEVRAARQALKASQGGITSFPLKNIDAMQAAKVVQAAYPNSSMRITWDAGTNAVFIQGSPADTQAVRRLLETLDVKKDVGSDATPRR
jgi:RNA polymerase sigma factor (sigma-70 family)